MLKIIRKGLAQNLSRQGTILEVKGAAAGYDGTWQAKRDRTLGHALHYAAELLEGDTPLDVLAPMLLLLFDKTGMDTKGAKEVLIEQHGTYLPALKVLQDMPGVKELFEGE